jgi:ABC-2 type transport system permease protein
MTTVDTRPAGAAAPPRAARARDVLACEWTKLRSIRSTYLMLLITTVTALGISGINASANANLAPGRPPADPLLPTFIGLPYAALATGLLGVLTFGSEHATGLIRTTFAVVPRRRAVLAAKAAVVGALTLAIGEMLAFASFFLVQAILASHHHGIALSHPGVTGAVLAEGTLLFVCAMLGTGLGAIIRHTAGSVAALFGLVALPAILLFLPAPWGDRIGRFTLIYAAEQVVVEHPQTDLFSPALSMLILLAWPAAVLFAAALLITRRDT